MFRRSPKTRLGTRIGGRCRRKSSHTCSGGIAMFFRKTPTKLGRVQATGLMSVAAMMISVVPLAGAERSGEVGADRSALSERPDVESANPEALMQPTTISFTDAPTWLAMGCRVAPVGSSNTPMAAVSGCDLWELVSAVGSCFVCISPKLQILKALLGTVAKIGGCLLCLERLLDEASDLLNGDQTNIMACIRAFGALS